MGRAIGNVFRSVVRVATGAIGGFMSGGPLGAVLGGASSILGGGGGIGDLLGKFASGFKMAMGGGIGQMLGGLLGGGAGAAQFPSVARPIGLPGGLLGGGGLQNLLSNSPLQSLGGAQQGSGLDSMVSKAFGDVKNMETSMANKKYDSGQAGQLQKMQDMQKMAQAFQMAVQLMRMKHDMAMAAIRNMKV